MKLLHQLAPSHLKTFNLLLVRSVSLSLSLVCIQLIPFLLQGAQLCLQPKQNLILHFQVFFVELISPLQVFLFLSPGLLQEHYLFLLGEENPLALDFLLTLLLQLLFGVLLLHYLGFEELRSLELALLFEVQSLFLFLEQLDFPLQRLQLGEKKSLFLLDSLDRLVQIHLVHSQLLHLSARGLYFHLRFLQQNLLVLVLLTGNVLGDRLRVLVFKGKIAEEVLRGRETNSLVRIGVVILLLHYYLFEFPPN